MPSTRDSAPEAEIALLRALICAATAIDGKTDTSETAQIASLLADYRWSDHEHRVVYQSLCAAHRNPAISLREQMAAAATRMGHPDVDWLLYFSAPDSCKLDVSHLVETLRDIDARSK